MLYSLHFHFKQCGHSAKFLLLCHADGRNFHDWLGTTRRRIHDDRTCTFGWNLPLIALYWLCLLMSLWKSVFHLFLFPLHWESLIHTAPNITTTLTSYAGMKNSAEFDQEILCGCGSVSIIYALRKIIHLLPNNDRPYCRERNHI